MSTKDYQKIAKLFKNTSVPTDTIEGFIEI